jgi:hypothetical protein
VATGLASGRSPVVARGASLALQLALDAASCSRWRNSTVATLDTDNFADARRQQRIFGLTADAHEPHLLSDCQS